MRWKPPGSKKHMFDILINVFIEMMKCSVEVQDLIHYLI